MIRSEGIQRSPTFLWGVVESLSHIWLFVTTWTAAFQASLSFYISQSLLKLVSIVSMRPSNHLILCLPYFSCPQSLPLSESFPVSQLFAWGGQSTGASASASVFPKNTQDWSPGCLISLQSKGLSRAFSNSTVWKHQLFSAYPSLGPTLISVLDYCINHKFDYMDPCHQSDISAF